VRLRLSAERHVVSVRRDDLVLKSHEFFIGAGGRGKLDMN